MDVDSYIQNMVTSIQTNIIGHQEQCPNICEIDKAPEIQTTIAAYSLQNNNCFQTVVESLSARGFVIINKHQQPVIQVSCEDKNGCRTTAKEVLQSPSRKVENNDTVSTICEQFECLSMLEGIVYNVQAASKENTLMAQSANVLAVVGPHPNIVSYFSNWTDARFHYVQMEFCPLNLSSVSDHLVHASDFCIVLEHIAHALHYLHCVKKYAHNRVNRWNIYQKLEDGGARVVYKLGGFHSVTKLEQPSDDVSTLADVRSLCSTVLRLMKYRNNELKDDIIKHKLLSYLSVAVKGHIKSNDINDGIQEIDNRLDALNVWQWCCSVQECQRQYSMDVTMRSV